MPAQDFDLVPDPRILPMLGEINLEQWRCLAELIDNSVDGFLNAHRAGALVQYPEVHITVPTSENVGSRVTIRDNGPGMAPETLERAVRAGWSGNSPIGNLGMFGMGFNIATARLGGTTTVWTAAEGDREWHGLRIDFNELQRQKHFRTPHLSRPKAEAGERGTEIIIEKLKPDQLAELAKTANLTRLRKDLSQAYSAMLRDSGRPISFSLFVNGRKLPAQNHCTWDESRQVDTTRYGAVPAVITIDRQLPPRPFCTTCWQWLAAGETTCTMCSSPDSVVQRARHVHGWVGLQRYLSASEFGIDFVRNGRKIEIANKDLFEWRTDDAVEPEYPIDDPRSRGRFVGEIHLDHCRVTYTKDRFDRTDPAWEEMWGIVRGAGPLRPEKASDAGFGANASPLFRLFQAYRRSSPHNARMAGGWQKVLVVKDNERAEEMAKRFHKGDPDYQTDTKWWELVLEEDNKLVLGGSGTAPGGRAGPPGFGGRGADPANTPSPPASGPDHPTPSAPTPPEPHRTVLPSLTREYRDDHTAARWDVRAFSVAGTDPALGGPEHPWRMIRKSTGEDEFYVYREHPAFRSATLTELDALLCQLAWSAVDLAKHLPDPPTFPLVLAGLRERYAGTLNLDPVMLKGEADLLLTAISTLWAKGLSPEDCTSLFNELTSAEQDAIYAKMAVRGAPQDVITRGRFLEYAPARTLIRMVLGHPELFFDGKCWDEPYAEIEYPRQAATEEARSRVVRHYEGLLADVVWLSEQEIGDLALTAREKLLRAALAMDLLAPVSADDAHQ